MVSHLEIGIHKLKLLAHLEQRLGARGQFLCCPQDLCACVDVIERVVLQEFTSQQHFRMVVAGGFRDDCLERLLFRKPRCVDQPRFVRIVRPPGWHHLAFEGFTEQMLFNPLGVEGRIGLVMRELMRELRDLLCPLAGEAGNESSARHAEVVMERVKMPPLGHDARFDGELGNHGSEKLFGAFRKEAVRPGLREIAIGRDGKFLDARSAFTGRDVENGDILWPNCG